MKKIIILHGQKVEIAFVRSQRARNIRLVADFEKGMLVVVPQKMDEGIAESFIRQKAKWVVKHFQKLKKYPRSKVIKTSKGEYQKNKHAFAKVIIDRVNFFNSFYKFPFRKISIRNQNTIWGSCTRTGNLQFNYKLALVDSRMRDYVIVHELCHLKEHNHSYRFWNLVAGMISDYKVIRKEMRKLVMRTD